MSGPALPTITMDHGRIAPANHVPFDPRMSPQKAASLLNKAARIYAPKQKSVSRGKITKVTSRGRAKGKVNDSVAKTIVGKHFSAGGKK